VANLGHLPEANKAIYYQEWDDKIEHKIKAPLHSLLGGFKPKPYHYLQV